MTPFPCAGCGRPYPATGLPARCPDCGSLYRPASLGFARPTVTLGEGDTPLVWAEFGGRRVGLKCESQNPTGSLKDRGAAALVSALAARGIRAVDEERILPARDELARAGFYVEPTSALALAALTQAPDLPDPVVLVLTGSGLKCALS